MHPNSLWLCLGSQCGVRRAAQLQESLTEEKAQVQQLKVSNMKLQDDVQMKKKRQHLLEVKIDALEEEGAKLKAEVVTFFASFMQDSSPIDAFFLACCSSNVSTLP
jgi:hypothetical protein